MAINLINLSIAVGKTVDACGRGPAKCPVEAGSKYWDMTNCDVLYHSEVVYLLNLKYNFYIYFKVYSLLTKSTNHATIQQEK